MYMSEKQVPKKISLEDLNQIELKKNFDYALHNHLLSETSLSSQVNLKAMYTFSKRVTPRCVVTNQSSSGRCWLFAGLNMIRNHFIESQNLAKDFEFSQSYLFFWDKLERINYFIDLYQKTKEKDQLDSQLVQFMLKEPLGDGGQWQMFANLIEKHGLVPKHNYPETKHSGNPAGLNMVLTKKLREYCKQIRNNGEFDRQGAISEVYQLLVQFLGKPPRKFDWEYYDKDGKFNRKCDMSPQNFNLNLVKVDLNNYVSITNDPRNPYQKNYGVQHLGNILEGKEVKYMNLEMERIMELVRKSIDNNEPVWFGSDVGQFLHSKSNIMDKKVFNMQEYLGINFGLNKRERIEYGESLMTHAMLITGYNQDRYGNIDRWEIENSWGNKGPNSGYYTMSSEWMREYVYQIVVNKKYLAETEKALWDMRIEKRFPPWDPMGALA
jgi:bleomycin hydrolase